MPKRPALFLHEEILLLALREKEGTVIAGAHYKIALGGAIVAELLLQKRISVDENKRAKDESGLTSWLRHAFTEKNMVDVEDDKPFDDELLDDCLNRMTTAKRRASLKTWVTRFANSSKLVQRIAEGLCRRRVLRTTQDKVLLIFNRTIYPEVDPQPERELIERLREAIFTETRDVDPRTAILLSLAKSVEMLNIPFDKKKIRARKKRIESLTSGELIGSAAKEAVQAAQTAVIVAATMPAIYVTAIR